MSRVVVTYKTAPERADENAELVERVFDELNEKNPDGIRYASFRLADGVSFVHIAETGGDANPLAETSAFAEFQREIKDRCVEGPNPQDATLLGSYRVFEEQG
jgi:hypothetical protein